MWNFGDNEFPYPSFLKVPFVFVPKGNPPPLDWMAEHPGFVTFAATFVPRSQPGPPPEAEPETVFAPHEQPSPEPAPSRRLRDDLWRIVPQPMMEADPRLARPFPDRLLKIVPPPRARLPRLRDTWPEWLRRILPPPGPRAPLNKLPDIAGFDAFHVEQWAGMDLARRMIDADGHASVVRDAMKHLDAYKGDIGAALASAKAPETAASGWKL